jgi:orotate phosphoribosyltransferase
MDELTSAIIRAIGAWGIVIILLLATIRTFIDVADSFDFLPDGFRRLFLRKRRAEVRLILEDIGLWQHRGKLKAIGESLRIPQHLLTLEAATADIDAFLARSVTVADFEFGRTKPVESHYLLNLRSRNLSGDVEAVGHAFASYIYWTCQSLGVAFDVIACPATSTLVLSYVVAGVLKKPLLVWEPDTKTTVNGRQLELVGAFRPDQGATSTAIIIDESAVSGGEIHKVYSALMSSGDFECSHCFLIFTRTEGDLGRYQDLRANVTFHTMREIGDAQLRQWHDGTKSNVVPMESR